MTEALRADEFDLMLSTLRYVLGAGQAKNGEKARDHYNAIINSIASRAERTEDADVRLACAAVKRAALAQPPAPTAQPVQQPGAEPNAMPCICAFPPAGGCGSPCESAPAQRQPLSDEEIEAIWKAHVLPGFGERQRFYSPVVYARAIESAHGITAAPAAQKGEKL